MEKLNNKELDFNEFKTEQLISFIGLTLNKLSVDGRYPELNMATAEASEMLKVIEDRITDMQPEVLRDDQYEILKQSAKKYLGMEALSNLDIDIIYQAGK